MSVPQASRPPLCVLLLPRRLESFIQREQAEDLLRAPGVVAANPPRLRFGAVARLPRPLGAAVARRQAGHLRGRLRRRGEPRVFVIFHPVQYPLARALLELCPGAELWYSRWDRYELAYDAGEATRARLAELHDQAATQAAITYAVSEPLVEQEREAGREAILMTTPADRFPAPEPAGTVVAVSLGHLGWRTDWELLRRVADDLGDRLVLFLVGAWHEEECAGDPDFVACRRHPSLVWLGPLDDEAAARVILASDVGIVPFRLEPFNDAGLPNRILKYARLGRMTVSPDLAGVRTWERAVQVAGDPEEFAALLAAHAGDRDSPDAGLREWALAQTASSQNRPLWERLGELGIAREP
ncbi:MAG: hypothetical protein ACKOH7_01225 [Solirubrobacterales bacterium]